MKLTEEEKKICREYSARDSEGFVHCRECPLATDRRYAMWEMCRKTMTKEEWQEYEEWCRREG